MLKLQRGSRDRLVNVILRDKENLFTRPFVIALTIAVGIHLALILLFHITPFDIGWNNTVLPLSQVQTDGILAESTVAELNSTIQTIPGLPPIPASHPTLMPQPNFLSVRPITYTKTDHPAQAAFTQIEQTIYQPEFIPVIYHAPQKPFQIVISGVLSGHELLSNGMDNLSLPQLKTESRRLSFDVLVEGRTGKIFWFEPTQQAHDSSIDKYAEKVLRKMKFAGDTNAIAISGTVEMQFNAGAVQ